MPLLLGADRYGERELVAAGDLQHLAGNAVQVRSAGSVPAGEVNAVAVAAMDDLLTQFDTTLTPQKLEVTVTLSDHGMRGVDLPPPQETAEAADHPGVAVRLGI